MKRAAILVALLAAGVLAANYAIVPTVGKPIKLGAYTILSSARCGPFLVELVEDSNGKYYVAAVNTTTAVISKALSTGSVNYYDLTTGQPGAQVSLSPATGATWTLASCTATNSTTAFAVVDILAQDSSGNSYLYINVFKFNTTGLYQISQFAVKVAGTTITPAAVIYSYKGTPYIFVVGEVKTGTLTAGTATVSYVVPGYVTFDVNGHVVGQQVNSQNEFVSTITTTTGTISEPIKVYTAGTATTGGFIMVTGGSATGQSLAVDAYVSLGATPVAITVPQVQTATGTTVYPHPLSVTYVFDGTEYIATNITGITFAYDATNKEFMIANKPMPEPFYANFTISDINVAGVASVTLASTNPFEVVITPVVTNGNVNFAMTILSLNATLAPQGYSNPAYLISAIAPYNVYYLQYKDNNNNYWYLPIILSSGKLVSTTTLTIQQTSTVTTRVPFPLLIVPLGYWISKRRKEEE
jgi:hypothetical protein